MQPSLGSGTVSPHSWAVTSSSKAGRQDWDFMSVLRSLGLRAPFHPAFPCQGELDNPNPILNPSCNIAQLWFVSFCWRLTLPKQVPLLHSEGGIGQQGLATGPGRTGHLRVPLCARPLARHQDTVSERGPCSPGAHSRTRKTRLSWPSQL